MPCRPVCLGLAAAWLAACAPTAETFSTQAARATCELQATCDEDDFEAEYVDFAACVDGAEDLFSVSEAFLEDCDFDVDSARECLASYDEATRSCDTSDVDATDCLQVYRNCF